MIFHTRAWSILLNQRKVDTHLQCMLKCSSLYKWLKRKKWCRIYISIYNIDHQYICIFYIYISSIYDKYFLFHFITASFCLQWLCFKMPFSTAAAGNCDQAFSSALGTWLSFPSARFSQIGMSHLSINLPFSLPTSSNLLFTHFVIFNEDQSIGR